MARGEKGTIFDGFHGRFNEHIVIKHRNGKPIMCFYPKGRKVKWTKNQEEHRQRFKAATEYAKRTLKNADRLAFYQEREHDGINATNLAIADYMHMPEIISIDIRKARKLDQYLIRVHATDDFIVTRVTIDLLDLTGKKFLYSDATQFRHSTLWLLRIDGSQLSLAHTIKARAYDLPCNYTDKEYMIPPDEAVKWIPHGRNKATG